MDQISFSDQHMDDWNSGLERWHIYRGATSFCGSLMAENERQACELATEQLLGGRLGIVSAILSSDDPHPPKITLHRIRRYTRL